MAMSSQLQIKGADEARRYKADRELWENDRATLLKRIEQLESGARVPSEDEPSSSSEHPNPASVASEDALASASLHVLRREIVKLRQKCNDMEAALQDVVGETEQIDHAINAMEHVRQRLASKKRRAEET